MSLFLQGDVSGAFSPFRKLFSTTAADIMFDEKTEEQRNVEFQRSFAALCGKGSTLDLTLELGVNVELGDSDILFVGPCKRSGGSEVSFDVLHKAVDTATFATAKMACACSYLNNTYKTGKSKYSPIFMSWFIQQLTGNQGRLLRLRQLNDESWTVENFADIADACKKNGGSYYRYFEKRYLWSEKEARKSHKNR